MRCYNCGAELSEHSFCTNCGVDVGLYKRIIRVSNSLYNRGLEKARVRDLSGAVVALKESIKFNKYNIKARNLLGLVYYEMGEVVAALSEWVISTNLRNKKNIAADYIERLRSNVTKMDTLNQSIKKYNQAYQYCLQEDGMDMAIVQLKRVIGMNPKLVRAYQLLGLVYLTNNKPKAAEHYLEIARTIDVNSTITLRYLKEAEMMLNPENAGKKGKNKNDQGDQRPEVVTAMHDNELIIQPAPIHEKRGSGTVLNIIIGIAIGFAISFFLILPARIQAAKSEAQEEARNIGTQLDAKNLTIEELEKANSDLNDQIESLKENLGAYAGTEGTLADMENILKAASTYLENPENYLDVADYIASVDESAWTDSTSENYKALYYALKKAIGTPVAASCYEEGNAAYNAKQYDDAVAYLQRAVFFDETNVDAWYLLATTYRAAEKDEDAKNTYNKILELFPDTWYSNKAEQYLKEYGE